MHPTTKTKKLMSVNMKINKATVLSGTTFPAILLTKNRKNRKGDF